MSYNWKHNEANGEGNRDGDNCNYSCNFGHEGPTTRRSIETVRIRQIKNLMATNLLSQGVPMIVFGDECRRTQQGNNNAYCQDNAISWFDWRLVHRNDALLRFVQALIAFRRMEPTTRRTDFLTGQPVRPGGLPDVCWYNPFGGAVNWSHSGNSLMCVLGAVPRSRLEDLPNHHLLLMLHGGGRRRSSSSPRSCGRTSGGSSSTPALRRRRTSIPIWTVPRRPPTGRSPWRAGRWSAILPATSNDRSGCLMARAYSAAFTCSNCARACLGISPTLREASWPLRITSSVGIACTP